MTADTLSQKARIELIDVLRGFSLLGIVIIHTVEQYYAGMMPESIAAETEASVLDQVVQGFSGVFIMGKFFTIFSFLFGLSFFIQFSKSGQEKSFLIRFTWRLLILFAIGFVHHLHYRGDILTIYALLGMGLLVCYRMPDRVLLIVALALVINLPSVFIRVADGLMSTGSENPFPEQSPEQQMQYYEGAKNGSYIQMLRLNLDSFDDKMEFQLFSGRIFITFGLFLLGLYAGRKRFFETVPAHIPFVKKLLGLSWKTILVAVIFAAIFFGGIQLLKLQVPEYLNWAVGGLVYDLFNACIALLYVTAIVLLFQKAVWRKRLMNFYEVGRMGLTTYLMQTLFGALLFFNYGLGMLSELSPALSFVVAIFLFTIQIVISKLWFRFYHYGPFEWLWRALTLFAIPPFRRTQTPAVESASTLA